MLTMETVQVEPYNVYSSSGEDNVLARPLNCFFKKHIGKDHLNRSVNMKNKVYNKLRN